MLRVIFYILCGISIIYHLIYKYKLSYMPDKVKKVSKVIHFVLTSLPFVAFTVMLVIRALQ